ncbi:MAG TPA: class I SAM-dependent methyltransferase [Dehalococcoidia bacterium]
MTTSSPIMTAALSNGIDLRRKNVRILDFGCGGGRQLVHFTKRFPDPSYFACDIDDSSIAFVRKAFPQVQAHVSSFDPPLKYEAGFFDMIYSVSILSHLSKEDESRWLPEMARIIRPGGLFIPTIMGRIGGRVAAKHMGYDEQELFAVLDREGIVYREDDDLKESVSKQETLKSASACVGVTGTYGTTIISREYVRSHWNNDQFELIGFAEGIIDYLQDMVVLRRREK